MARKLLVAAMAVGLLGGCAGKRGGMDMPQKPAVANEMALLGDMVGSWSSTWEFCGKMAEEMRKQHPDAPMTFKGETTWVPYMDGLWYKAEGWYEMGPDLRATYVEYIGYSPKDRAFHSYFFSDMGEVGHGVFRTCGDDTRCFNMKWRGHDLNGVTKSGEGCMRFVDRDTVEYCWSENLGLFSKMEMKGTSKRKKS